MLSEFLRAAVLTGFPWNPLGVIWLPILPVAQGASWVGAYGLSATVILCAGAVALLFRRQWKPACITELLAATAPLLGETIPSPPTRSAIHIPIRIIQPNIAQDEKYDPKAQARNASTYASLSRAPGSTPRVFLWPEAAGNGYLQLDKQQRAALARLLGPQDLLLTGGDSVSLDPSGELVYYNSVFAINDQGSLLWRYDKAHLVPFGEYLPWRPLLSRIGLSQLVAGDGDFSSGPGPQTFELAGFGSVGVQICYEITFSGHVVDRARRPVFLFNPSNDAWFGSSGPPQHLAQARLRAIKEGLPVVRATTNGISAVIDAAGNLLATVPPHQAGAVDVVLPPGREPTIFARFRFTASALFAAMLCGVAWIMGRGRTGVITDDLPASERNGDRLSL